KMIRKERYSGMYQRSFYVGENIEEGDIHAAFADGVLKLSVPKKEEQPKVEEKKLISIE
ncbi:MAG: Hsp20 family protein, partial [Lachnospiraceae bacterium]|nr:Hsp20 family protein [Lachnospiraceae bacterium]